MVKQLQAFIYFNLFIINFKNNLLLIFNYLNYPQGFLGKKIQESNYSINQLILIYQFQVIITFLIYLMH